MNVRNYLYAVLGITLGSVLLFGLPLFMVDPEVARGYVCGVPPQIFVSVSWVGGYAYAQRHCPHRTFALTMGMIPVRFLVEIAWFLLLRQVDGVDILVAVGSAVIHFALYSVPQTLAINSHLSSRA